MKKKIDYSVKKRRNYLDNRNMEVSRLRDNAQHLNNPKIQEYVEAVIKSYEQSTIVHKIASYKKETVIESPGFRSIGLSQTIDKEKLFAEDYYWFSFFSDVGRAISRAEQKYIHERLNKYVRGIDDTISLSKPDFSLLSKFMMKIFEKGFKPDVMLAPIQIYSKFVKNCLENYSESNLKTNQIRLEGHDIQIIWSHKYAPLHSFIIFDSSNGIWHAVQDIESESELTVAMGESKDDPKLMQYFAETMVFYEVLNRNAFTRINLST
jgi:hypothetical protein